MTATTALGTRTETATRWGSAGTNVPCDPGGFLSVSVTNDSRRVFFREGLGKS